MVLSRSESLYETPTPIAITAPRKSVPWTTAAAGRVGVLGGAGRIRFLRHREANEANRTSDGWRSVVAEFDGGTGR